MDIEKLSAEQGLNNGDSREWYYSIFQDTCIDRINDVAYHIDGTNLFKSSDNETWTLLSQNGPWMDEQREDANIKLSAHNGIVYVQFYRKVWESLDEGQTWTQVITKASKGTAKREGSVKFGTLLGNHLPTGALERSTLVTAGSTCGEGQPLMPLERGAAWTLQTRT